MEETFDSKYEFNAPKYIDFLQGDVDEDADRWFDERDGDEGGIDIDMVPFYEQAMDENGFQNATSAISAALKDNEIPVTDNNEQSEATVTKDVVIKKEKLSIIPNHQVDEDTEMMDTDEANETPAETVTAEPQVVNPTIENKTEAPSYNRTNTVLTVKTEKLSPKKNVVPQHDVAAKARMLAPVIKPRISNIRTTWDSPSVTKNVGAPLFQRNTLRRSCNNKALNYSETKKRKKTVTEEAVVLSKKHKPEVKLSNPKTPLFVRKLRERGLKRGQSSEAMQLNKIRAMQKQTRESMKKNEKKMKQALKAGPYVPNKSSEVTRPVEFNFESDKRPKVHSMNTRIESSKTFQNQLRQHPPSPTFKKEPTKVKPFNFVLSDKTVLPSKKWESMAQFAMNYQTKTPERFRAKPRKTDSGDSDGEKKSQPLQLTTAKTPILMTKKRSRAVTVESANQLEEKVVEDMRKYQFKATEFNHKIVEKQGMYGVKKIPESSKTEPKPFHFESDARIEQRKIKTGTQEPEQQPLCSKINTSHNGKTERPRKTEVKPFSFENRDKERYMKKEEKIKGIVQNEEKMHEFHARPLPSFSPDALPTVSTKEYTKQDPFKISSGSTSYHSKYQQQVQDMEEQEKANRIFKAKEATVTKKEGFKPLSGLLPPTNVKDVVLNSDVRAIERAKFEEWKHEQERKVEEEKIRFEKEKELQEEEQVKQLRKDAVPKAHAIRHYKPVELQKSSIPLTTPLTPNFECKKRAAIRQ